jgi:membrane associated rhomboid family serine protease
MADTPPPIPPMPPGPAGPSGPPGPEPAEITTCYRHPDRRAGVVCQRCDRPICPSCMTAASVGFQCPECVKQAAKASPTITARSLGSGAPVVTYALIAANVLAFLAQLSSGGSLTNTDSSTVTNNYATTPYVVTQHAGVPTAQVGEWYRLFTGGFLHHDIIHIGLNMFMLWLLGSQLERILGPARYAALYFVSLVAGGFAVVLAGQASVGASGAIFGLLGATAAYQRLNRINMLQSGLAMLIVVNLVISFSPGISMAAHVGGLLAGGIAGWAMFDLERRRSPAWLAVTGAAVLIVALTIGGVAASQHMVATGHAVL